MSTIVCNQIFYYAKTCFAIVFAVAVVFFYSNHFRVFLAQNSKKLITLKELRVASRDANMYDSLFIITIRVLYVTRERNKTDLPRNQNKRKLRDWNSCSRRCPFVPVFLSAALSSTTEKPQNNYLLVGGLFCLSLTITITLCILLFGGNVVILWLGLWE